MLEKTKKIVKSIAGAVYKKVYIINFEKCSQIPAIKKVDLVPLGDWFVSEGLEWICHSDYPLEEFQNLFLQLVEESERDHVRFEEDFMPFGKA